MLAAMSATVCKCRHSYTAHVVGSRKGCSFCNCPEFVDPATAAAALPPKPLTEQAQRALDVLSQNKGFRHVARERLADIASQGKRRLFLANAYVMHQGDASDSLHILVKGSVKVERSVAPGKSILLAELEAGDIVGEMGVLNGDPRTATVQAIEDLETLEVSSATLKQVFQEDPEVLLAIMKVINERLKSTEELVEESVKVALTQFGDK
jgi:CRP/FNR family cyclic AMP-dependent transcriptional regulator